MTGKDFFEMWAPIGAKWVEWIRPVPFVALDDSFRTNDVCNFTIPKIDYIDDETSNVAVIIDTPGYEGIVEGMALAKRGFRPIPLYNGTDSQAGAMAIVDTKGIENALIWGAFELEKMTIGETAQPAFLLDSNRTHRFKMNSTVFDNSWDLYYEDMPSAEYFLDNGINKIVVRGEKIQKDLAKILYKFQEQGIKIFYTNGFEKPQVTIIKKRNIRKALKLDF